MIVTMGYDIADVYIIVYMYDTRNLDSIDKKKKKKKKSLKANIWLVYALCIVRVQLHHVSNH